MSGSVTAGYPNAHAGRDLLVAVDNLEAPLLLEESEVLGLVRRLTAGIRMAPRLQLPGLDDVPCAGEQGRRLAVAAGSHQRSHVVEMQVAQHHQVDVRRL